MNTVRNVSLAREASDPQAKVYLVVGDTKFWITDPAEFDALGFRWSRVQVVDGGTLAHLKESRLRATPATRPSDVFFDCEGDIDISKRNPDWDSGCLTSRAIVRRDVLIAGWLMRNIDRTGTEYPAPFVNHRTGPKQPGGIEDVLYDVALDAVFLERMYGPSGLSSKLEGANIVYPGASGATPIPFAAGMPIVNGRPSTVNLNSWSVPEGSAEPGDSPPWPTWCISHIHTELNTWHKYDTNVPFQKRFAARNSPVPAGWVSPFADREPGAYFPFHPENPEGQGQLLVGDYLVMRGTLWQDSGHRTPPLPISGWNSGPTLLHGHSEIHPIDWIARVQGPAVNLRRTACEARICLEPRRPVWVENDGPIHITPDFHVPQPYGRVEVRTVEHLEDLRPGMTNLPSVQADATRKASEVEVNISVTSTNTTQGRYKASWLVGWSALDVRDEVPLWVDDSLPSGTAAVNAEDGWNWASAWNWAGENVQPFHGTRAHLSGQAAGIHQHYFVTSEPPTLETLEPRGRLRVNPWRPNPLGPEDRLFATVWLDPDDPPSEVMLQWRTGRTDWGHRAFWGKDVIPWGTTNTKDRRPLGRLPFAGEWVRLRVQAGLVGLVGETVTGVAFTLSGGRAAWDYAGVEKNAPDPETL